MTDVKPLKILRYPDAIPTIPSLKSQALWADEILAFWPDVHEPEPVTQSQERALEATLQLKDAGIFLPKSVEGDSGAAVEAYAATYKKSQGSSPNGLSVITDKTPLFEKSLSDAPKMSAHAARNFLYSSKLTYGMIDSLVNAGLIKAAGDPYRPSGFTAPPRFVEGLIATIAEDVARRETDLTLVPSNASATHTTLAPTSRNTDHLALAFQLPALPDVSPGTPIESILDIRASRKFEQARYEYLALLQELRDTIEFQLGDELTQDTLRADFLTQIREDLYASTAALGQMSGKVHGVRFGAGIGIAQVLVAVGAAVASPDIFPILSGGLALAGGVFAFHAKTQQLSLLRMASTKGVQFTT